MVVRKFGGTSVQDANAINKVIEICGSSNETQVIVVSAFSRITNQLIQIINEIRNQNLLNALNILDEIIERHRQVAVDLNVSAELENFLSSKQKELNQLLTALDVLGEVSPKSNDLIVAHGELLSSYLIYHAFLKRGFNIEYIDSRSIIKTDSNFGEANVNFKSTQKAVNNFIKYSNENKLFITSGFVTSNAEGQTTVLGRGGSDYSASVLASCLNADVLEIWTDVDGIMSSDPRIVSDAKIIRELSYEEASELAYFGAKVLHPKTIYPAIQKEIPVWVKNTYNSNLSGTKIIGTRSKHKLIKAIAFRKGISVININSNRMLGAYGFLSKVFEIFRNFETSVDIVTTSEVSISLTIDNDENLSLIKSELSKFATVTVRKNQGIICAVGEGIRDKAGIAARFFGVLKGVNISMVSIGASEVNISIILSEKDLLESVRMLHSEFFKKVNKEVFYSLKEIQ